MRLYRQERTQQQNPLVTLQLALAWGLAVTFLCALKAFLVRFCFLLLVSAYNKYKSIL